MTTSDPDQSPQSGEVPEDPHSELFACVTAADPAAETEPPDSVCTCEELLQAQRNHGPMADILERVEKGEMPTREQLAPCDPWVKAVWAWGSGLETEGRVLVVRPGPGERRVVVPPSLTTEVVRRLHEDFGAAHHCVEKTRQRVAQR